MAGMPTTFAVVGGVAAINEKYIQRVVTKDSLINAMSSTSRRMC